MVLQIIKYTASGGQQLHTSGGRKILKMKLTDFPPIWKSGISMRFLKDNLQ